jgi:hypothetical protein
MGLQTSSSAIKLHLSILVSSFSLVCELCFCTWLEEVLGQPPSTHLGHSSQFTIVVNLQGSKAPHNL